MKVIRPIASSDYQALHDIAVESGIGFTSLPVNEVLLRSKIERSELSFDLHTEKPGNESYLFVMEDTETGEVTVLSLKSAYEVGRQVNPALVEGQIRGGSVMGMSHTL